MIKLNMAAAILLFYSVAAVFVSCHSPSPTYDLNVFRCQQGWGYEIRKNSQAFIYQEYIPAIEGNHRFPDKQSARKTGRLVVTKLNSGKMPGVTRDELIELGVIGNHTSPYSPPK